MISPVQGDFVSMKLEFSARAFFVPFNLIHAMLIPLNR